MRSGLFWGILPIMLVVPIFLSGEETRGDELDPAKVKRAIDGAIRYLRGAQQEDGSWPEWNAREKCGATALCTLALLNAGVPKEDPAIERALFYLRGFQASQVNSTYSVALQTMVFCAAHPQRDLAAIRQNVRWLEKTQTRTEKQGMGGWSYQGNARSDNSNSQFAVLALYEAERVGISAEMRTWRMANQYWRRGQNEDGSWGYIPNPEKGSSQGTGSMTCAGIAGLAVTSKLVEEGGAEVEGEQIRCCLDREEEGASRLEEALDWMADHFSVRHNPGTPADLNFWLYYYLYGLERAGRLTSRRFIGEHDWYREGTDFLLKRKGELVDYWSGKGNLESKDHIVTSLALLFLSKGRRPVLLSKLRVPGDPSWNVHPNDVNHLTRYVESQWKLDLVGQTIDIDSASVDELLQSPVLYLCGDEDPLPSDPSRRKAIVEKLRDYLDQGGFLFADALQEGEAFDQAFRDLVDQMLPEPEYQLRVLPPEHPIWRAETPIAPEQLRKIEGVDFGCRTSVIYSPPVGGTQLRPSLSCLWELSRPERGVEYPGPVRAKIEGGLHLGINVLAYATNRELKFKYEIPASVTEALASQGRKRGYLTIALLQHPGGANAAPRAIPRLLRWISRELDVPVEVRAPRVGMTQEALFDYPILYMHGRTAFRWNDAQRKSLRTFLQRGGFLFANSICASEAFTQSFRREMSELFPQKELADIEAGDSLLGEKYGGFDLEEVTLRIPQRRRGEGTEVAERTGPPDLEGIRIEDRWAVVFSPFDVSCALEKSNSLECKGYNQEDALRIALNAVLYALEHL